MTTDVFTNRKDRRDKTRLSRWLTRIGKSSVSRGCKAWLLVLAERSDNTAKSVWGLQAGQAKAIQCSPRQIRRYRAEAEVAGLVIPHRGKLNRREDGTFYRSQSTRYQLCIGAVDRSKWKKSRSDGADIQGRYNPSFRRNLYSSNSQKTSNDTYSRVPEPKTSCEECDSGWIETLDGTNSVYECPNLPHNETQNG